MIDSLRRLFSEDGFMPHGMCYLWKPGVLGLHIVSDTLITLAYFSIPFILLYFVRKRRDLEFNWMFVCFAIFIVACGTTHLMEIWLIWHPVYWLAGGIKAVTALASVPTAILLVKLIPDALRLPSPAALQRANLDLQEEVADRERAQAEVHRMNQQLESRVAQRTRELETMQQSMLQQERLRALGQIASGIAHDINNSISPAALYTATLLEREPGLSESARRQITTIQRSIEDVARTVARLREFYRQREPQLTVSCIDLNQLVEEVIALTRARWSDLPQQRGIVIEVRRDLATELPATFGAENEIRDALTNLIFNAVDAMPEGGTLTLRTGSVPVRRGEATAQAACVEVQDTGLGMDEETRRRCLEPFFTTKGERGTGLGLAMVYGMVQRHSAEIEIDSAPGRGTTMRLIFPASTVIATPTAQTTQPHRLVPALRILVVDDDPSVAKSLRDTLEGDGHSIAVVGGGQAGIDAFRAAQARNEPFDFVITDLGMPHIDGRKVAAAIRSASPSTPIILLTGWGQRLIDDRDVPPQVDRVLSKPPALSELRRALAELGAAIPTPA